jgi:hypothetical protein
MSQVNVEIVRRAFEFEVSGQGGRAEALADFDPNVVMNPVEEAPSYGLNAFRDNFKRWSSAWDELEVTADRQDRARRRVHQAGRSPRSGRAAGVALRAGPHVPDSPRTPRAALEPAAGTSAVRLSDESPPRTRGAHLPTHLKVFMVLPEVARSP